MKNLKGKRLEFIKNSFNTGDNYCVLGAIGDKAEGNPYLFEDLCEHKNLAQSRTPVKVLGKTITKGSLVSLMNLNDSGRWERLTRRLMEFGLYDKVKKYAIRVF